MRPDKTSLILGVFLIAIGGGWLLTNLEIAPRIDWAWSLLLAVIGILAFVVSGIDKMTVVVGSLFCIASLLSILRQLDLVSAKVEMPTLVVLSGILILVARLPVIPRPAWWDQQPPDAPEKNLPPL